MYHDKYNKLKRVVSCASQPEASVRTTAQTVARARGGVCCKWGQGRGYRSTLAPTPHPRGERRGQLLSLALSPCSLAGPAPTMNSEVLPPSAAAWALSWPWPWAVGAPSSSSLGRAPNSRRPPRTSPISLRSCSSETRALSHMGAVCGVCGSVGLLCGCGRGCSCVAVWLCWCVAVWVCGCVRAACVCVQGAGHSRANLIPTTRRPMALTISLLPPLPHRTASARPRATATVRLTQSSP